MVAASAVAIGNFDGCHRGHQELIRQTLVLSREKQLSSVVLTFDPNPKQFFQPHLKLGKLFTIEQKIRALRELQVETLVIQSFDAPFSQLSPKDFYASLIKDQLNARAIVVGHDFCFGAQREGNVTLLRSLAMPEGDNVCEVSQQVYADQVISSSRIRKLLVEREIHEANLLLQRPYLIEGKIVMGRKLGRTLGFPTANLDCGEQLLPGKGVYAGFALIEEEAPVLHLPAQAIPCILNIGQRPTVEADNTLSKVEVHLLDGTYASESLYAKNLSVWLTDFIRDEQKFPSLDILKEQIRLDCEKARQLLPASKRIWNRP